MNVPVMAGTYQRGSPDAGPLGMEEVITEGLDALQCGFEENYGVFGEGHDLVPKAPIDPPNVHEELCEDDSKDQLALRNLQERCGGNCDEQTNDTEATYYVVMCPGGRKSFRLHGTVTLIALACALVFVCLPVLMFMVMEMRDWEPSLPLLTDLKVPGLIMIQCLFFACAKACASLTLEALRKARHRTRYAVLFLSRLLCAVCLVVWFKANIPVLTAGLTMMLERFIMAAFLFGYDNYSKYLICKPKTLPDLYGQGTCVLPEGCGIPSGNSVEEILQACACLYEILNTSEYGEIIQMQHNKYGPHMRGFVRDNALGACVWVFALCSVALVTLGMLKMILDDANATLLFYGRYREERRKGAARSDAFHAAALGLIAGDTPLTEPLPVAGPSRAADEQAEVLERKPTSAVEPHTAAGMEALPVAAEAS